MTAWRNGMAYYVAHPKERERIAAQRLERHRRDLEICDRQIAAFRLRRQQAFEGAL